MASFGPVSSLPVSATPAGGSPVSTKPFTAPDWANPQRPRRVESALGLVVPAIPWSTAPAEVTWIGAEVLHSGAPAARVGWIGAEVLHPGLPAAQVSWIGVEVLHSVDGIPYGTFRGIHANPTGKPYPLALRTWLQDYVQFEPPAPFFTSALDMPARNRTSTAQLVGSLFLGRRPSGDDMLVSIAW